MRSTLPLLIISLMAGCGHYSRDEKAAFGALVASHTMDGLSTDYIIGHGGRELNPLLGNDRPSDSEVYLFKAGVVGIYWLLGEVFPEHREEIFIMGTWSGILATGWNTVQIIGE